MTSRTACCSCASHDSRLHRRRKTRASRHLFPHSAAISVHLYYSLLSMETLGAEGTMRRNTAAWKFDFFWHIQPPLWVINLEIECAMRKTRILTLAWGKSLCNISAPTPSYVYYDVQRDYYSKISRNGASICVLKNWKKDCNFSHDFTSCAQIHGFICKMERRWSIVKIISVVNYWIN